MSVTESHFAPEFPKFYKRPPCFLLSVQQQHSHVILTTFSFLTDTLLSVTHYFQSLTLNFFFSFFLLLSFCQQNKLFCTNVSN